MLCKAGEGCEMQAKTNNDNCVNWQGMGHCRCRSRAGQLAACCCCLQTGLADLGHLAMGATFLLSLVRTLAPSHWLGWKLAC
jgi:hypothetical protein